MNTVGGDLDLSQGMVSAAILQRAGPGIQAEVRKDRPRGLQVGELVASTGGNMKCQAIIHLRVPVWDDGAGKVDCARVSNETLRKITQ